MLKISKEDCRSLELKIQKEIKKIFSEFMKDLENKTVEPDEPVPAQEQREPGPPRKLISIGETPTPAEPKKYRKSKTSTGINKILHSASPARTNDPGKILESDMEKIFRKKQRRGSH